MEGRYRGCNGNNHEWESYIIVDNKHAATCTRCHKKDFFSDKEWTKIENQKEDRDPTLSRIKELEQRVADLELILKRHGIH